MLIPFRNLCRIVIICAALLCLIPAIGAAQTQFSGQIQSGNGTATLSNGVYYICPRLAVRFSRYWRGSDAVFRGHTGRQQHGNA
jgi:hypothetical protein